MEVGAICKDNGRVVTLSEAAIPYTKGAIVTCNERMRSRLELLGRVAPTDLRVLITGEPGSNKQDYAEHIHQLSKRSQQPYIRFDCAAVPEERYEERLFGSAGERRNSEGMVEAAHAGTLLLDGMGMVPEAFYGQLERLLERGTIVRRGERKQTAVNTRILATCSEDVVSILRRDQQLAQLLQMMAEVRIDVLPLRSRPEDVALLTLYYLDDANSRYGTGKRMGSALFREMMAYTWPGNERQLKNFVEQLVLSTPGEVMDDPQLIRNTARLAATLIPTWRRGSVSAEEKSLKEQVTEYELMIIRQSISRHGSLRKAAKALKVDPSVLSRKLAAAKE